MKSVVLYIRNGIYLAWVTWVCRLKETVLIFYNIIAATSYGVVIIKCVGKTK